MPDAMLTALRDTDVIFAVDPMGEETLIYGENELQRIVSSGRPKALVVARVPIPAGGIEQLRTLVRNAKCGLN